MGLHLSADDTTHLSAAVEALLTPAADADPVPWWRDVESRLRTLFGGANAMITWPDGERLRYAGAHLGDDGIRRLERLSAADPETGLHINFDPAVVAWFAHRRANGVQVWNELQNFAVMDSIGIDGPRGLFYNEGLLPSGFKDCSGTTTARDGGELFVTIGYDRRGQGRFGGMDADAEVLRLLLPVIRTAHHQIAGFAPRRAAAATCDALADALVVVGPDAREVHRSAALRRALAGEPARDVVVDAMHALARAVRDRGASPVVRPERVLSTALARYVLRASYAPAAAWGVEGAVQVALTVDAAVPIAPVAPTLAAADLVAPPALGLTAREAEVAGLLARRLSNAELAAALGVSAHTARHHTERVLQKLGLRRRGEVAGALLAAAG